jgi:hypothetical protein
MEDSGGRQSSGGLSVSMRLFLVSAVLLSMFIGYLIGRDHGRSPSVKPTATEASHPTVTNEPPIKVGDVIPALALDELLVTNAEPVMQGEVTVDYGDLCMTEALSAYHVLRIEGEWAVIRYHRRIEKPPTSFTWTKCPDGVETFMKLRALEYAREVDGSLWREKAERREAADRFTGR